MEHFAIKSEVIDMGRLDKLLGKPKEIEIEGEKITIHPLSVENLDVVMNLSSENEVTRNAASKRLMELTLKKAFPEEPPERIKQVALSHLKTFSEAIMDVNNINQDDAKKAQKAVGEGDTKKSQ